MPHPWPSRSPPFLGRSPRSWRRHPRRVSRSPPAATAGSSPSPSSTKPGSPMRSSPPRCGAWTSLRIRAPCRSPASPEDTARAAERAFTTIAALAETLIACLHAPLARIGTGADRRRRPPAPRRPGRRVRSGRGRRADPARRDGRPAAGVRARVARRPSRARGWLREPTAARWVGVAARPPRRAAARPAHRRRRLDRPGRVAERLPARCRWPAPGRTAADVRAPVGIFADDGGEPPWAHAAAHGRRARPLLAAGAASRRGRPRLPAERPDGDRPGPLAPALDVRLRTMAVRESHAQASTYRFTADSHRGRPDGGRVLRVDAGIPRRALADGRPPAARIPHRAHRRAPRAGARGDGCRIRPHPHHER